MVTFVLMRGFGVGGGKPCLERSLMWGQVVPAGSPGMALPGPDVVSPGFPLILLLLTLSQCGLGQCGVGQCCSSLSLLCPAVRLQLPDGAERGSPPAAQPHPLPAGAAVLRAAAGACVRAYY